MENSKPKHISAHALEQSFAQFMQAYRYQRLLLAFSGGLDSTVLLHLLLGLRATVSVDIHAVYVHHGLSAHADHWAEHCQALCHRYDVPFLVSYIKVSRGTKLGVEASARELRYQALQDYAKTSSSDYIVTAHHQDDQAETLLIQLCRGAGVKGLSAMPQVDERRHLLRPLLHIPRVVLSAYAQAHKLTWCEDDSNADTRYTRNFMRHNILPLLSSRFEHVAFQLAKTATYCAEASGLLEDLAQIDMQGLLMSDDSLCLLGLRALPYARAKNVLRGWLIQRHIPMPNHEALDEWLQQLCHAEKDSSVCITVAHQQVLRVYQQRAYILAHSQPPAPFCLWWHGKTAQLALPHGGYVAFNVVQGQGLRWDSALLPLRVTNRQGGERLRVQANRPTQSLKHLLQQAKLPPWQRERMPLIYWQDKLVCVPNISVSADFQTAFHQQGLEVVWHDKQVER